MTPEKLLNGTRVFDDNLSSLVDKLRGKKVLVTGAVGSLGSILFDTLHQCGVDVVGVDWDEDRVARHQFCKLGDFADHMVDGYDYIFHTAAYKHVVVGEKNKRAFMENNVLKTEKLLKKYRKRLVMASTDKAAGGSFMGMTKRMAEVMCVKNNAVALRLVNLVGSRGSVIHRWERDEMPKCGPRDTQRYWIQPMDAVQAMLECAFLPCATVYTVADVPSFTLGELAEVYERDGWEFEEMELRAGETKTEKLFDKHWESLSDTTVSYIRQVNKS